jgi:hypothetical protein
MRPRNSNLIWSETVRQSNEIGGERRDDRRYDMRLELRWKVVRRKRVVDSGVGLTLDLSRGGVRFHAGRVLPVGFHVELDVEWPVRLSNGAPMQLSIHGKILRSAEGWAAVHTLQHEFRTLGVQLEDRQPLPNVRTSPRLLISSATVQDSEKLQ